jgi:hypothetical protein
MADNKDTKPKDPELKMQKTVGGKVVDTHGVTASEWKQNGDALQKDGWSLVQ